MSRIDSDLVALPVLYFPWSLWPVVSIVIKVGCFGLEVEKKQERTRRMEASPLTKSSLEFFSALPPQFRSCWPTESLEQATRQTEGNSLRSQELKSTVITSEVLETLASSHQLHSFELHAPGWSSNHKTLFNLTHQKNKKQKTELRDSP